MMTVTPSSSPVSPPTPKPATINSHSNTTINSRSNTTISRRHSSILLSFTPFLPQFLLSSPALALNLGISGPKDWLREQKKKSIKYLLAPIAASDDILRYAYQLLSAKDSSLEQKDLEEIQSLLKSAGRDCVPEDRNSLVTFQAKTGVEVCTFKLIVKNASSLLGDDDYTKLEAEARLNNLIRSFSFLNDVAKEADFQAVSDRQKVANAVMDSMSSLHEFEQGIKECIGV